MRGLFRRTPKLAAPSLAVARELTREVEVAGELVLRILDDTPPDGRRHIQQAAWSLANCANERGGRPRTVWTSAETGAQNPWRTSR